MSTNDVATALQDPVAQQLLSSTNLAHLAYTWSDGTPRVVPVWFHWNGSQIVIAGPAGAPKAKVIKDGTPVCITIDNDPWPSYALTIRGTAHVDFVDGIAPEYMAAAQRYLGVEAGTGAAQTIGQLAPVQIRIAVTPESVTILDFDKRWPSTLMKAMAAAQPG